MEDIYLQHRDIMSVEEENMFWLLKKKVIDQFINPFQPNTSFLHFVKTLENPWFSTFFSGQLKGNSDLRYLQRTRYLNQLESYDSAPHKENKEGQ